MSIYVPQRYFGFVYIWHDKEKKQFYIGSHMGRVDDGYVCSSNAMRAAYRRRSQDFKRRILYWLEIDDAILLRKKEQDWLSLIASEELGQKYYNKIRAVSRGPNRDELSRMMKTRWSDTEFRTKMLNSAKKKGEKQRGVSLSKAHRIAIGNSLKGRSQSEQWRQKNREAQLGKRQTNETILKRIAKTTKMIDLDYALKIRKEDNLSMKDLAKRFGVSDKTLRRRFKNRPIS